MAMSDTLLKLLTSPPWAKDGDRTAPEDRTPPLDRAIGWPATFSEAGGAKPSRRVLNQLFYELTLGIAEVGKSGILAWNATIDYEHPAMAIANGQVYISLRDNTNADPATSASDWTRWPPPVPAATETAVGSVELATPQESADGAATDKAVTPAGLVAFRDASANSATATDSGFVRLATSAEIAAESGDGVLTVTQAVTMIDSES